MSSQCPRSLNLYRKDAARILLLSLLPVWHFNKIIPAKIKHTHSEVCFIMSLKGDECIWHFRIIVKSFLGETLEPWLMTNMTKIIIVCYYHMKVQLITKVLTQLLQ